MFPLAAHQLPDAVRRIATPTAGASLEATRAFRKGDILWSEPPLMSLRHSFSQRCTDSCGQCMRPLGTLSSALSRLLSLQDKPNADYRIIERLLNDKTSDSLLSKHIPCPRGCNTCFCSTQCATEASASWHGTLCSLRGQQRVAWGEFVQFAMRHCEGFILAGLVYAAVISDIERGCLLESSMRRFWCFENEQIPWPDIARFGVDLRGEMSTQDWHARRAVALKESFQLLCMALQPEAEQQSPNVEVLFDETLYSKLCGQIELTTIWISVPITPCLRNDRMHPKLMAEIKRSGIDMLFKSLVLKAQEADNEYRVPMRPADGETRSFTLSDALDRLRNESVKNSDHCNVFPDVQGMGFFKHISYINHSCCPNVVLEYRSNSNAASVVACRDVNDGDELSLAYLDFTVPWRLGDRHKHLLEGYGFVCTCDRCVGEAKEFDCVARGKKRKYEAHTRGLEFRAARTILGRIDDRVRFDANSSP
ncbi:unnamed protein product [Prorocentrum cordatum]|uniref:SET domain-containing protein n=1 Tax=Prorocentrum cordatum TaxID=2364126 RepID=A0ABN9XVQ6_9DINO|nr:unnamed protein product [Polarella glacialis]